MLKLFTPGHNLYTDTLILNGLTIPLCKAFEEDVYSNPGFIRARSLGHSFELRVGLDEWSDVASAISDFASGRRNALSNTLTEGPLGFFVDKDADVLIQSLTDEGRLGEYLRSLSTPLHAERYGEGRGRRGRCVKLPLMPVAGKYLHEDLTTVMKYPPKDYKACNYCFGLAALGLAEAAFPVMGRAERGRIHVVVLVSFEGEVGVGYYAMLMAYRTKDWEDFYRKLYSIGAAAQLPLRTLMKLVVSAFSPGLVRAMSMAEARWHALGVSFAGRRRAPEVRGFHDLEMTAFIYGLSVLYERGATLITDTFDLLRLLVEHREGDALEALLDFISNRSFETFYRFARGAHSAIERERVQSPEKGRWSRALGKAENWRRLARELLMGR